jgi:hypothetical protein
MDLRTEEVVCPGCLRRQMSIAVALKHAEVIGKVLSNAFDPILFSPPHPVEDRVHTKRGQGSHQAFLRLEDPVSPPAGCSQATRVLTSSLANVGGPPSIVQCHPPAREFGRIISHDKPGDQSLATSLATRVATSLATRHGPRQKHWWSWTRRLEHSSGKKQKKRRHGLMRSQTTITSSRHPVLARLHGQLIPFSLASMANSNPRGKCKGASKQ